jgi:hypothetical protein
MEVLLLRDADLFPSADVLKDALGSNVYEIFDSFMNTITDAEYGLSYEWRYYNDGKSWLCKVSNKKKTIFWLSVWDGYFQIGFFFTEKYWEGIAALEIDETIKEDFCRMKPVGKLIPMIFKISRKEQLDDLLKVITFKKNLK